MSSSHFSDIEISNRYMGIGPNIHQKNGWLIPIYMHCIHSCLQKQRILVYQLYSRVSLFQLLGCVVYIYIYVSYMYIWFQILDPKITPQILPLKILGSTGIYIIYMYQNLQMQKQQQILQRISFMYTWLQLFITTVQSWSKLWNFNEKKSPNGSIFDNSIFYLRKDDTWVLLKMGIPLPPAHVNENNNYNFIIHWNYHGVPYFQTNPYRMWTFQKSMNPH